VDTGIRAADLSGRRLGHYRLEELIGTGAFGSVYRGRHVHLGVPRAVKVLRSSAAELPELQARFLQEARTAAGLSHPRIVPVYDFGVDGGVQYIVMEYVESVTLARFLEPLAAPARLADGAVLSCVADVAAALDHAHASGVVHRDLKPANVLVRDSDHRALLTDFGVAKVLSESGLTQTGLAIGSYAYMSPEQCSGVVSGLTARADVYAFAALLYEVACGDPPFGRDMAAVGGHLHRPVPSVRPASPELAAALDPVLGRGLAKRPEERYPTAGELAAAFLEAVMEPTEVRPVRPTPAPGPAPPPPAGGAPSRRRRVVAAAASAVLVLAGSAGLAVARGWTLGVPRPQPSPSAIVPSDVPASEARLAVRAAVGKPVDLTANGNRIRVTVLSDRLHDAGTAQAPLFDDASDRFVDVRVRVENRSTATTEYGSYDWVLVDSRGHTYGAGYTAPVGPLLPSDITELPPGGTAEGYVSFEVPRSATGLQVWELLGGAGVARVPLA
jgi:hypothetical protein